jgi:CRP-like cAMP-binding protein
VKPDPTDENGILASLSKKTLALLTPGLTLVNLVQGETLHDESGGQVSRVYFPLNGLISVCAVQKNGVRVETCTIGREGIVAKGRIGDGWRSFGRAVVHLSGSAMALDFKPFEAALRSEDFARLVADYQSSLYYQAQQVVACQALHSAQSRLCFRLLRAQAAVGDTINMTQELLSSTMVVRRSTVSNLATQLKKDGLISYARGVLCILNRRGLAKLACDCWRNK